MKITPENSKSKITSSYNWSWSPWCHRWKSCNWSSFPSSYHFIATRHWTMLIN